MATGLTEPAAAGQPRAVGLLAWAESTGRKAAEAPGRRGLRFAFYGRVSTEDWQDPVTSRARQREQAEALVRGHGTIVAEFFDIGESRVVRGRAARRPPPWPPRSRTGAGAGTRS